MKGNGTTNGLILRADALKVGLHLPKTSQNQMYNSGHIDSAFPVMRAHAIVILTGPNGSLVLEPEEVNKNNFAQVMQVKV